jgi:ABC-type glutathione transport system ATPase component
MTAATFRACVFAAASVQHPLLEVRDLVKNFPDKGRALRPRGRSRHAVDGVSFEMAKGENARVWSANQAAASRRPAAASCT